MDVTISSSLPAWPGSDRLRVGERLSVEVVSQEANGEGVILLGGQAALARLDTALAAGERFVAVVREISDEGLVLIRQSEGGSAGAFPETGNKGEGAPAWLAERGLPVASSTLLEVISALPEADNFWQSIISAASGQAAGTTPTENEENLAWGILKKRLPVWSLMDSTDSGGLDILNFWRCLGIEHESKLRAVRCDSEKRMSGEGILRDSSKAQVLAELGKSRVSATQRQALESLLDHITTQQLWFMPGDRGNGYLLWQLPLEHQGKMFEARIAIEAKRSGGRLDARHCRIALLTDTAHLGRIGVDCWFGENIVFVKLLSDRPDKLEGLVDQVLGATQERLAGLGLRLAWVGSRELEGEMEFWRFIRGRRRSGVDIRR